MEVHEKRNDTGLKGEVNELGNDLAAYGIFDSSYKIHHAEERGEEAEGQTKVCHSLGAISSELRKTTHSRSTSGSESPRDE